MRSLSLAGIALLTACGASEVQSQRLKDGSWSFTCELGMDECVRRVQEHCANQRYRILEGTSETRLRDAPPFERAYHTSRLHLACTDSDSLPLLSLDGSKASPKKADAEARHACTLGETRECIGPGACKGGQACLRDGSGFGACDCGPAATPAVVPPVSAPTDAGSPATGTPITPASSP